MKKLAELIGPREIALVLGLCGIGYGLFLINPAYAFIAVGVLLFILGVWGVN